MLVINRNSISGIRSRIDTRMSYTLRHRSLIRMNYRGQGYKMLNMLSYYHGCYPIAIIRIVACSRLLGLLMNTSPRLSIQCKFHWFYFFSELVDETNLKYLDKKSNTSSQADSTLPFICNSKYASGSVFFSSILDAIIAQSYFNATLFEVLDKLIFGGSIETDSKVKENCKLSIIEVDHDIGGKTTFCQFFQSCISNDTGIIIPIGILRYPN